MEINSIKNKEIELKDIPQIDLYMDQITSFFEDKFKEYKRNEKDVILTKTMINNYVKAKILTPVINKKYNQTQIVLLIFIYKFKQILSLEDIKFILEDFLKLLQLDFTTHSKLLFEVYTFYINELANNTLAYDKQVQKIENQQFSHDKLNQHQQAIKNILYALVNVNIATKAKKNVEWLIDKDIKKEKYD